MKRGKGEDTVYTISYTDNRDFLDTLYKGFSRFCEEDGLEMEYITGLCYNHCGYIRVRQGPDEALLLHSYQSPDDQGWVDYNDWTHEVHYNQHGQPIFKLKVIPGKEKKKKKRNSEGKGKRGRYGKHSVHGEGGTEVIDLTGEGPDEGPEGREEGGVIPSAQLGQVPLSKRVAMRLSAFISEFNMRVKIRDIDLSDGTILKIYGEAEIKSLEELCAIKVKRCYKPYEAASKLPHHIGKKLITIKWNDWPY